MSTENATAPDEAPVVPVPGPGPVPVHVAWSRVMRDVGAIGKGQRNADQNFMFRGIDDVMNALQPALIRNGVFILPEVLERSTEARQTKSGAPVNVVHLHIRYTVWGPSGDTFTFTARGEGADMADKATSKASSMALKYALLHSLMIPTKDEAAQDADRSGEEAGPVAAPNPAEMLEAKRAVAVAALALGWQAPDGKADAVRLAEAYAAGSNGGVLGDATLRDLRAFEAHLRTLKPDAPAGPMRPVAVPNADQPPVEGAGVLAAETRAGAA